MENGASAFEKILAVSQKAENRITIRSNNSTAIPKGIESKDSDTYMLLFVAARFTTAERQKPRYPSTNEWINNMWYGHTMEYYSAIKKQKTKNEVPIHATTQTNLENITVSEISQPQRINIV